MNVRANHPPTAEMQATDAAHHLHPFTHGDALNAKGARIITRADGVWLTDSDGNEILDAMAGLWCVNIGYGRNELAEAAARQMRELPYYNTFFQTSHPPVIALARRLAELAPGDLDHVFFAGSGSEANDTNIRLVRSYWAAKGKPQKRIIISRKNAYHGSTLGAASLGGMQAMHGQGGLPLPDMVHIDQPYWYGEGGDTDPAEFGRQRARALAEEIDRLGEANVAAFIAEPVQGAGGVVIPPETYWPEIQAICDAHEILLIADEVITGFGRTGEWFGIQGYGIRPDIMTIAKGLTSGYAPMGGSIVSSEVAATLNSMGEFYHGYTYSGHPVAAAVALENLRILDEEHIVAHARDVAAPYLAQRWAELGDHPLVGEARTRGMLGALELSPDKSRRAPFAAPVGTVGLKCREICFRSGLVMRNVRDSMIVSPPLILSHENIDTMFERAVEALDRTHKLLEAEGLMVAG